MKPIKLLAILLAFPFSAPAQLNTINTIAGNGSQGYSGDGGAALSAELNNPTRARLDAAGNLYFIQPAQNVLRKVSPDGIITTVAGNGSSSSDDIPASDAYFSTLRDIAIAANGDIYTAEMGLVRKIDGVTGIINTICGTGMMGNTGDGGPAINAGLSYVTGLAVDSDNNLYLACDYCIRKIDAVTGIINTICGDGTGPGNSGVGGPALNAKIVTPESICVDDNGNVYFANMSSFIGKIDVNGILHHVAGGQQGGYSGDGGPSTLAFISPQDMAFVKGRLYIAGMHGHIRMIDHDGTIYTIAGKPIPYIQNFSGDGGHASDAEMSIPRGIAVDTCENLFIADSYNHRIRKVTYADCHALAVNDITDEARFSVYPNPAKTELTISAKEKILSVKVYDIVGSVVYTARYKDESVKVDVSMLHTGVYFLSVNDESVIRFLKE